MKGSLYDDMARQCSEGTRLEYLSAHRKIDVVIKKTRKYLIPKTAICEIGLGDGYLLKCLLDRNIAVTGIDVSSYIVKRLGKLLKKQRQKPKLIEGDIAAISLEPNSFDVIYALDVLEHIYEIRNAIQRITDALKIGGTLVVTVPWKEHMGFSMTRCPECGHAFHSVGHYRSFHSMHDIRVMLGERFVPIKWSQIYSAGIRGLAERVFRWLQDIFSIGYAKRTMLVIARRER